MAVPDEAFPGMFQLYQETLRESGLRYTIFGHIGDNHVHVNILPRNDEEGVQARELYVKFLQACSVGWWDVIGGAWRREVEERVFEVVLFGAAIARDGGAETRV